MAEITGKLDKIMEQFDTNDQKKIFGMMMKTDMNKTLNDLQNSNTDELKQLADAILPKVVFQQ